MKTKYDYIGEIVADQVDSCESISLAMWFCSWYGHTHPNMELYPDYDDGLKKLSREHTAQEVITAFTTQGVRFNQPLIGWDGEFHDMDAYDVGYDNFASFVDYCFTEVASKDRLYSLLKPYEIQDKFAKWYIEHYGVELTDEQYWKLKEDEVFYKDWRSLACSL